MGQSSIQHTTLNQLYNTQPTEYYKADISKYILFSINISLIEISKSCYLNPAYLAAFLFELKISAVFNGLWISIPFPIQARPALN